MFTVGISTVGTNGASVFECCVVCAQSLLREREATLNIDQKAEERYLMLPELGRALQALRKALPGACVPQPSGWGSVTVSNKIRVTQSVYMICVSLLRGVVYACEGCMYITSV